MITNRYALLLLHFAAGALTMAPTACAQATAPLSDVEVDAISRTTARITWKSSRPASYQLLYGEAQSYGMTAKSYILVSGKQYSAFLSGLRAGTTYYFCPQTTTDEQSPCDGQRNTFKFTTVAGELKDPILPKETVEISQPELKGQTFLVKADCADLQEQINQAAQANPDQNHEVRIPPGSLCHGRYTLPDRAGAPTAEGWITIRGDVSDEDIPPQGVQINPSYAAKMPILRSNYVSVWFSSTAPEQCVGGDFWWKANARDWQLFRCADPNGGPKWDPIPVTASGTAVPSECSVGDWFFKSDEPDRHRQAWWCLAPNSYQNLYFDNGGYLADYAVLHAAPQAHHYRIQGVQLTHVPLPPSYGELFNSKGGRKRGSVHGCLAMTPASSHHVTFDRVWFRGQGFPSSLWYAFCTWDGAYQAIVNSYFNEINRWVHPDSGEDDSRAINIEQGPGPGRVENNTFENAVGITLFVSDDAGDRVTVPSDYTIRRNRFFLSDAFNVNSEQSNGRHYYRRHHLELKRGIRFLVEGNIFDGGWTSQNLGASVSLSPRTGPSHDPNNKIAVTDVLFRNNLIRNAPEVINIIGHTDSGEHQTMATQRVAVINNLIYGLSGSRSGWGGGRLASGQFLNMGLGVEDLKLQHNTIYNSQGTCCFPNFLSHAWDEPNAGLNVQYNVFTYSYRDPRVGIWLGGGFEGKEALDRMWRSGLVPQYTVTNNIFYRPGGDPGTYPKGNIFVDNVGAIGFGDQFQLTEGSAFKAGRNGIVSDGKDMGVDIVDLKKALHVIEDLQLAESEADRAVLSYQYLSDNEGIYCAADLSAKADYATFSRFWDNGQGIQRTVELSGLLPNATYYLRLQCAAASLPAIIQTGTPDRSSAERTTAAKKTAGDAVPWVRILSLTQQTPPLLPALNLPSSKHPQKKSRR